jgi:hypothetical protein
LYNKNIEDTVENNKFFDKPWHEVTDEEINNLAKFLEEEYGGWIFHSKVDKTKKVPWIKINVNHPEIVLKWINQYK